MAKGSRDKIVHKTVSYNGKNHKLAIVGPGRNISKAEKIKIADLVCEMYSTDDYTIDECLNFCGINSDSTWWKWQNENKEIESLYLEAQRTKDRKYIHNLKQRARTLTEKLLDGGIVRELVERTGRPIIDARGGTSIQTVLVKRKEVLIKPTAGLISTILYNTDPRNFERNPKPVEKINKDVDIDPITWVD